MLTNVLTVLVYKKVFVSCGEIHLEILCTFLFFLLWSCEWAIKAKFNFGPMDFWWALVDNFIYFIPSYWKFKPNSNISECWPHVMHKFLASQGSMTQLVNSIIALPLIRVKTEKERFVPRVQTTMSIIILCIKYIHLHFYLWDSHVVKTIQYISHLWNTLEWNDKTIMIVSHLKKCRWHLKNVST